MLCKILKTFHGSQDGRYTEQFTEGSIIELSDDLYSAVSSEGWVIPVGIEIENKAIVSDGSHPKRGRPKKIFKDG